MRCLDRPNERSGPNFNRSPIRHRAIDFLDLKIGDRNTAGGPVLSPMESARPAAPVWQSVDHDVAPGRQSSDRRAVDVVLFRIRNVEGAVVIAVGLVEIDRVKTFGRA